MFKFILPATIGLFLTPNANANINCSNSDLHQKHEAICLVEDLIKNGGNREITRQVQSLTEKQLIPSNEYNALFLGGNETEQGYTWTYLVGIDFYNVQKFRSIAVVVKTFPDSAPRVKEVLSQKRIEDLVE